MLLQKFMGISGGGLEIICYFCAMKYPGIKYSAVLVAATIALAAAGRSAAAWLTSAPESVISGVPRSVRLDAIDYFRSGMARDVRTDKDVPVRITELTENTVTMNRGEKTSLQLAALKAGRDTILALVTTVRTEPAVSGITFYDSEWNRLKKAPFSMPEFSEWLRPGTDADMMQAVVGFVPAEARFSATADTLVLTNTAVETARLNNVADDMVLTRAYIIKNGKFTPLK